MAIEPKDLYELGEAIDRALRDASTYRSLRLQSQFYFACTQLMDFAASYRQVRNLSGYEANDLRFNQIFSDFRRGSLLSSINISITRSDWRRFAEHSRSNFSMNAARFDRFAREVENESGWRAYLSPQIIDVFKNIVSNIGDRMASRTSTQEKFAIANAFFAYTYFISNSKTYKKMEESSFIFLFSSRVNRKDAIA